MIEKIAPYNIELQQLLIAAMLVGLMIVVLLSTVLFMLHSVNKARVEYERYEHKRMKLTKKKKGESWGRFLARLINNYLTQDNLSILAGVIFITILLAILFFAVVLILHSTGSSFLESLTMKRFGMLGDFFGGFIGTLIAAIVAIYAIRTYKSERELQKAASVSAMLSTMLDLHKKNVEDIKIVKAGTSDIVRGREAFKQMYEELNIIFDHVMEAIVEEIDSDREKYADWVDDNKQKRLAHILSYGYFFYSVDSYMIPRADDDANLYQLCEKATGKVPKEYKDLHRHVVLGHYYRHLYNMVNYIDKNEFSQKYQKKELYVKLIRSQLSDYEQILLYYDTLSLLGKDWNEPLGSDKIEKMNLICKYRLIKNCPSYMYYFGLQPSEVYAKEKEVWDSKKEYFLETDSKWQQEALKEMLK